MTVCASANVIVSMHLSVSMHVSAIVHRQDKCHVMTTQLGCRQSLEEANVHAYHSMHKTILQLQIICEVAKLCVLPVRT